MARCPVCISSRRGSDTSPHAHLCSAQSANAFMHSSEQSATSSRRTSPGAPRADDTASSLPMGGSRVVCSRALSLTVRDVPVATCRSSTAAGLGLGLGFSCRGTNPNWRAASAACALSLDSFRAAFASSFAFSLVRPASSAAVSTAVPSLLA